MELTNLLGSDLIQLLETPELDDDLSSLGIAMAVMICIQLQPILDSPTWKHLQAYPDAADPVEHLTKLPCGAFEFHGWLNEQLQMMLPIFTQFIKKPTPNETKPTSDTLDALDEGDFIKLQQALMDNEVDAKIFAPYLPLLENLFNSGLPETSQALATASSGLAHSSRKILGTFFINFFSNAEFDQHLKQAQERVLASGLASSAAKKGTDIQWSSSRKFKVWVIEQYLKIQYRDRADAARKLFKVAKKEAQSHWPNIYRTDKQFYEKIYRWLSDYDNKKFKL